MHLKSSLHTLVTSNDQLEMVCLKELMGDILTKQVTGATRRGATTNQIRLRIGPKTKVKRRTGNRGAKEEKGELERIEEKITAKWVSVDPLTKYNPPSMNPMAEFHGIYRRRSVGRS